MAARSTGPRARTTVIRTSLIVVNFESEDLTVETVEHVARLDDAPEQILVVDNSPQRGLEARLAGRRPGVDYLAAPHNLGFGGGVNLGLENAAGDFVVLLNPDARPGRGCRCRATSDVPI